MQYRQHHEEGKLHHGLSSSKYKIKPMRRQSQRLQDICPTDRGVRFLCLVTCYRLPHRPTGKGPTASGEICPKRLLSTDQCLRDDVNTRLGHTTTKKRQCKNHHALQDQAYLWISHQIHLSEMPEHSAATLNNIVNYQSKRAFTKTASSRPPSSFVIVCPNM